MTHAKTGCMPNRNLSGVLMNSSMKDFVTSEERLATPPKFRWYDLIAIIVIVAIGGLQSWL